MSRNADGSPRTDLLDIVEAVQTAPALVDTDDSEPEPTEPPPLTAIEGNGRSSTSAPRQQSLLIHAVPDSEPAPPLYDQDTGEDHRAAAEILADLKRKWSTGT
jgi:hypothetical protein